MTKQSADTGTWRVLGGKAVPASLAAEVVTLAVQLELDAGLADRDLHSAHGIQGHRDRCPAPTSETTPRPHLVPAPGRGDRHRLAAGIPLAGAPKGDDLGEDRQGDLLGGAAPISNPAGVRSRARSASGKSSESLTASPRIWLATNPTYGTPSRRAAVRTRSSSCPCDATTTAASPALGSLSPAALSSME